MVSKKIKLIVTGGGAPGIAGTIYSLRNNLDRTRFEITTVDISDNVVGKYLSDNFYKVPPPEDPSYLSRLREIVRDKKIGVILPQTSREINVLSANHRFFNELGAVVVTSSRDSIERANDKYRLVEAA